MFLDRNRGALIVTGESIYGLGYTLETGEPLPWHATLQRMVYPLRERRRLTFARAKLFGEKLTPQKWAQDVRDIAGKGNVEYTWVFNNGNGKAMLIRFRTCWLTPASNGGIPQHLGGPASAAYIQDLERDATCLPPGQRLVLQ